MRIFLGALVDAGHDVTLITTHPDNADLPVPVVRIAQAGRLERRLPERMRVALLARRLRGAFRSGRFDVLNVQQLTSVGILAARLFEGPVVATFWGSDLLLPERHPAWARALLPGVVASVSVAEVCSSQMREVAIEMGASPDRVPCFQYGVDLAAFEFGGLPRSPHTVVSNRLLKPLYRVDVLIAAFALVLQRVPDARLTIMGDGSERGRLEAMAADLGLSDVITFRGFVPNSEVAEAVRHAEVWVSLPESDAAAISLMEAMASGAVPVVADLPAMRDWVEPGRGVLVDAVTPAGVADAIMQAFAIADSGEYAAANRARVERDGDRAKNLPRFVRLVEDAAAGRPPQIQSC